MLDLHMRPRILHFSQAESEYRHFLERIGPYYLFPPEFRGDIPVTPKADIFLYAEILLALHCGSADSPGRRMPKFLRLQRIVDGWRPEIPSDALPLLRELITDCCRAEPKARPSAEELFKKISDSNFAIFAGVDPTRPSAEDLFNIYRTLL
jgi:serine/threonine protein kinase